jgi:hypothetical protein
MFPIMITCPATGRTVSTGVNIDGPIWNRKPEFQAHTRCPACWCDHAWSAKDVLVCDRTESSTLGTARVVLGPRGAARKMSARSNLRR